MYADLAGDALLVTAAVDMIQVVSGLLFIWAVIRE